MTHATIKEYGFTNPILTDVGGVIVAGHGRWEGAKLLGLEMVPTIQLESMTPEEVRAYGHGALHYLLSNPVYAGYIRHKGILYEGLHEGILPKEKWQHVQDCLKGKACTLRGHKKRSGKNILKGKIFDTGGVVYTPMRANKNGIQYRYYVSQNLIQNRNHPKSVISRLPAHEIETSVLDAVAAEMRDIKKLSGMLGLDTESNSQMLEHISKYRVPIHNLHVSIHKVVVDTDRLTIEVRTKGLAVCINATMNTEVATGDTDKIYSLVVPYYTKRACKGAVMIQTGDEKDLLDRKLEPLVKGIIWRDEHFRGKSFVEISRENNCSRSFVIRLVRQSLEIA